MESNETGSGSVISRNGSADPDNSTDPQHCFLNVWRMYIFSTYSNSNCSLTIMYPGRQKMILQSTLLKLTSYKKNSGKCTEGTSLNTFIRRMINTINLFRWDYPMGYYFPQKKTHFIEITVYQKKLHLIASNMNLPPDSKTGFMFGLRWLLVLETRRFFLEEFTSMLNAIF